MSAITVEEFIPIGGVTTSILKCGEISSNGMLALIIPGNPGVSHYYTEFMEVLHKESQGRLPVWCVSHAGHGITPGHPSYSGDQNIKDIFGLQGQIKHKISFVENNIPKNTKLILIGHSIGCYIILHMLQSLGLARVVKCLLLYPTFERMALSPKGRKATPLLKNFRWIATFAAYSFHLLPSWLTKSLIQWYFKGRNVPYCAVEATLRMTNPYSIGNSTYMARQEMLTVVDADHHIIKENLSKLLFYYGASDHWCPVEYYHDIKARYPEGDIILCEHGFEHAFVLESSADMAQLMWQWLERNIVIAASES